jgi:hypothetical protein
MYRLKSAELKPVHDWIKTSDRYWRNQLGQIKECAERQALEGMIASDSGAKGGHDHAHLAVWPIEILSSEPGGHRCRNA